MATKVKNPKIDALLDKATRWQDEMKQLRTIALDCGLNEELKWGKPTYTSEGKNIVVLQGFKGYCALLFLKGYLLKDPKGILVKTGPNTKVGRQARFTEENSNEIPKLAGAIKACIRAAIAIEKASAKRPARPARKSPRK